MVNFNHDVQICAVVTKKVSGTKMIYSDNCEKSGKREGARGLREGSVQRNNEERSSFLRRAASCVGVGFGTTGVERRSKINAQSHGMR